MAILGQLSAHGLSAYTRHIQRQVQFHIHLMACSIHISTARTMLNSGDPVDISVWLSACRFRSAGEKEIRRHNPGTAQRHFSPLLVLRRVEKRKDTFLRRVPHDTRQLYLPRQRP